MVSWAEEIGAVLHALEARMGVDPEASSAPGWAPALLYRPTISVVAVLPLPMYMWAAAVVPEASAWKENASACPPLSSSRWDSIAWSPSSVVAAALPAVTAVRAAAVPEASDPRLAPRGPWECLVA